MNVGHCEREAAVLEAVQSGRWPDACEGELRAHVAQCAVCGEVIVVAELLRQDDAAARAEARLPAPGLLWWKAQIRARRLAAQRAAEPITVFTTVTWIAAAVSLVALGVWQWSRVAGWWTWFHKLPFAGALLPQSLSLPLWTSNLVLLMTLGLGLALVSFVFYLTFSKE